MSLTTTDNHLLLCTGAPLDPFDDKTLGEWVRNSSGSKIVMGGTTAKIIARELGREITVNLTRDPSGLPPTSHVDGFEIISEGVLTLTAVRNLLRDMPVPMPAFSQNGVKYDIVRHLMARNIIDIIEGLHINPTHLSPNLPVKLEKRADLIQEVISLLRDKYGKQVTLRRI